MDALTLKQLRYFEALALHGHFGRAADASAISQPALSVQIRELETGLGLPLFERGARQANLTGFGEEVAVRVRGILQAVEELHDLARAAQGTLAGRLRIGVIPTVAPYMLPRLLADLAQNFPSLEVQVRETQTDQLIHEMTLGQLDTAIVALPVSEPSFHEESLFEEPFLFVRPKHEEDLPVPAGHELGDHKLLLLEEGHCFRDQALAFCNIRPSSRSGGLDGSSLATLVQMVGAGLGVTVIPEMAASVEARSADVSVASFEDSVPSRTVGMIWRRTSPLAERLVQIAELVRLASHRPNE